MPSPLVDQGSLNRLRASVVWAVVPQLNVIASYLGTEGISLTLEGEASTPLPTMTGIVQSPEPYQMVTFQIHLLKTQALANAYKTQQETNAVLGNCTIRPDSRVLSPYFIYNCSIASVGDLLFNGTNAGYGVSLKGYYPINSDLWDA